MVKKVDLYEALKVGKAATLEQIKKAYRKKAKETHPDNGGNAEEWVWGLHGRSETGRHV
jgi:curved DNA-binding protein CbpA